MIAFGQLTRILLKCTLFLDERTYSQLKMFALQNYWSGTCALYPPKFLRPCYRIRCANFLDERTYSQLKMFALQNYWSGTCALYPPPPKFLRPCYRIREIINGIKVLSYRKGDIERSQISYQFHSVELTQKTYWFKLFFTPVVLKTFCVGLKRVESKQLHVSIQHHVILLIVKIGYDFTFRFTS